MIELVVARYQEDLEWLRAFDECSDFKVTIYNKGPPIECGPHSVIARPNVGREAETWLYHCTTRYDTLADHTVFLQGYPFDHTTTPVTPESLRRAVCPYMPLRRLHTEFSHDEPFPMSKWYAEYLFGACPPVLAFSPGAQYLLSRERIHRHPPALYTRLHTMCSIETPVITWSSPVSPTATNAWILERLWPLVWA
jgi:hypothetical protein